ncbi:MBL fold metallo-hydrolase [Halomarina litorea]|uniref:MBL fold metallo-hydrolase n=1 Tax=Halomarina litorea TaxID=2961595 RepID=UPI0020C31B84|nr:MBL fold metallo-hydrolase [Halomarina sp. BCD28]
MSQEYPDPERPVTSLDAREVRRRLAAGESVHLLDVRNRSEIDAWRIEGENVDRTDVPYMKFVAAEATDSVADLVENVAEPVVAVCARGEASAYVASLLEGEGIEAANLAGGMEGWARLYEATTVSEEPRVVQYARPSSGCLAYLVVSDGEAAVVDPLRAFADRYVEDAREYGAELRYALDTHVHADHVSALRELAEEGVGPVLPAEATERGLADPERFTLLEAGDSLAVGRATVEAVAAPGHTTEMTAYRVRSGGDETEDGGREEGGDVLLTGDGLFTERVPRPDLEAGDEGAADHARDLHRTLVGRFADLPDDALVAPGHYDPADGGAGPHVARLGDLRESLPAFGMSEEEFVAYVTERMGARPANFERVIAVNLGREAVDEGTAFELELGPNNCAAG